MTALLEPSHPRPSRVVVLFCLWLLFVTGGPGLLCVWAVLSGSAEWATWLPLPGFAVALFSVALVERPRSLSPVAYLLQLRARVFAVSLSTPDAERPSPQESSR